VKSGSNGGVVERELTYDDIACETHLLATSLQSQYGLKKGDLAVLVYPPSLDFIIAFLACLKIGVIAVPVFPPHPSRKDTLVMFSRVIKSCGATVCLTNSTYSHAKKISSIKDVFTTFTKATNSPTWPENLQWIVTDTLKHNTKNTPSTIPPYITETSLTDIAFLQFTSGSTSDPKGVMITHGNLADNLLKITTDLKASTDTIVASWLPQYHDMGLIGSYLGIVYCGGCGYYMSPLTFLQRPMIWLEVVSKYSATHLQAPNFAYKLTARKLDPFLYNNQKQTTNGGSSSAVLDLSSVKHMINAAEPVTEESINLFMDTFGTYGLNPNVMFPTYGLAEHTVFVCSGGKQRLTVSKQALEVDGIVQQVKDGGGITSDTASRLIGCGFPSHQNVDVRIVDTESFKEVNENTVGEIWVRSPSKAIGYYQNPQSRLEFCAMLGMEPTLDGIAEEINPSLGYLRTGDLGFLYKEELFVCGRMKDLIIVGGRNYYPQDIEGTAESCASELRPGCSAAFTVDPISGDGEDVAIVMEMKTTPKSKDVDIICGQLVEDISKAVKQIHSLSLSHVILLQPRTVHKTTSGKIARAWCRKAFINKTFTSIIYQASSMQKSVGQSSTDRTTPLEIESASPQTNRPQLNVDEIRSMDKKKLQQILTQHVSDISSVPTGSISPKSSIVTLMDSLSVSQFKGLLETQYGVQMSDYYLFKEDTTIIKLVEVVKLGYAPDDEDGDMPSTNNPPANPSAPGGLAGALGCPPGVRVCCSIM